jgi:hypothetical protein
MFPPSLDVDLRRFGEAHDLVLMTRYQDAEVRSFTIVRPGGSSFQIWVENAGGTWCVNAWDFGRRRYQLTSSLNGILDTLEKVYAHVLEWTRSSHNDEATPNYRLERP